MGAQQPCQVLSPVPLVTSVACRAHVASAWPVLMTLHGGFSPSIEPHLLKKAQEALVHTLSCVRINVTHLTSLTQPFVTYGKMYVKPTQ